MKYDKTINKICEKTGHVSLTGIYASCLCEQYKIWDTHDDLGKIPQYAFLGFLKSKKTLIAVFGEEIFFTNHFEPIDPERRDYSQGFQLSELPSWQIHEREMGYTLEEILSYYQNYLGVEE